MDFPSLRVPVPPILTTCHAQSLGLPGAANSNFVGIWFSSSSAWPSNNRAYYYPFRLTDFATARQLLFWVGGTSSGNIDVGIYDNQFHRIVSSGSTAMSATVNTVQELNITDTPLPPGDYYIGVVCSTTSGTCFNAGAFADELTFVTFPVYLEALGATTLPATATPSASTDATPPVFIVGIQFASAF